MATLQGALQVLYLQERPDTTTVIKEAILLQKLLGTNGSLGLVVCGPNAMNKAVGQALGMIERKNTCICIRKCLSSSLCRDLIQIPHSV